MSMRLLSAISVCVCAAAISLAQPPSRMGPGGSLSPADLAGRRVSFLSQQLNLTDAQKEQATTIFTDAGNAEAAVRDKLKAAHESLAAAVKKNDAAGIDAAAGTVGSLTTQSTTINAKANAAFYQLLTDDQKSNFNVEAMGLGFGGGMGGPGGRMGGGAPMGSRGRRN